MFWGKILLPLHYTNFIGVIKEVEMFNHESESLAEAIGIERKVLFQENLDFYSKLGQAIDRGDFESLEKSLYEKPRVLVAVLTMLARRQVLGLLSPLKDEDLLVNCLGLLAQGVGGLNTSYTLRPSEEIEVLSVLPQRYLAAQAIIWGLNFLAIAKAFTGNEFQSEF